MYEGKNTYIAISLGDVVLGKFFKALKHLATLKGAKLVDDDLF